MKIAIVSDDEMKKLRDAQERHELEELRASVQLASTADAKARFDAIEHSCAATLHICEEAYLSLADDALDDFETAKEKADKMERIEREHDRCISIWENQIRRLNWEARQAQQNS